jgi:hypothetical protein
LHKKENTLKGMKGEALEIYRAIEVFYKATIILMVRWSLIRARFSLNCDNLFAPLTVNPEIVIERIAIHEIPIEELVTSETMRLQIASDGELRRRHSIPGYHEFPVSLQAFVNKATCIYLCGHVKEEDSSDEEGTLIE